MAHNAFLAFHFPLLAREQRILPRTARSAANSALSVPFSATRSFVARPHSAPALFKLLVLALARPEPRRPPRLLTLLVRRGAPRSQLSHSERLLSPHTACVLTNLTQATTINQPTFLTPAGNGNWGEAAQDWIEELAAEGSLTQEYLASLIDTYYGIWESYGAGMWGLYKAASSREGIAKGDPEGWRLTQQFFSPFLTWMVYLDPSLTVTYSMTESGKNDYTRKSQYYLHATLLGENNSGLMGNEQDNCLAGNAGENVLDGGEGEDVAIFRGKVGEYEVNCADEGGCEVVDTVEGRDGITKTEGIEVLSFIDGDMQVGGGNKCQAVAEKCWELIGGRGGCEDEAALDWAGSGAPWKKASLVTGLSSVFLVMLWG